jgi:hypothetical protein
MKWISYFLSVGLMLAMMTTGYSAGAKTKHAHKRAKTKVSSTKSGSKPVAKASDRKLETNVKFDDSSLYGKYQVPDEALAKVENEKVLENVLGVRKHFKDRLLTASEQE